MRNCEWIFEGWLHFHFKPKVLNTSARLGLTGASTHAQRMPEVETALQGRQPNEASIEAAAAVAGANLGFVNSDIHASEAYRRAMVKVFTRRALEGAIARA